MPLFNCSKCDYETKDRSNANKHIKNKRSCFGAVITSQTSHSDEGEEESVPEDSNSIKTLQHQLKMVLIILDKQSKQIERNTDQIIKLTGIILKNSSKEEVKVEKVEETQAQAQAQAQVSNNVTLPILNLSQTFKKVDEGLPLGRELVMNALKQKGNPVVNLIREIHFNTKFPEYMNVVIRNKRLPDCLTFNKVWTSDKKENVINELISNYELSVHSFIGYDDDSDEEDNESDIDPFLKSCREKLKIIKKNADDGYDKELYDQIHDLLYDNRDMIPK